MSFLEKINPISWIKNTVVKRMVGSVIRKLIAGLGVGIIALGALAGVEQEGKQIAEEILKNQDVIFEYVSGAALFLGATVWGLIDKFKNR